jgi:hypothetical protein
MSMKDLQQYRLIDIDQGKLLMGVQAELNKAAAECIKLKTSTSVKVEIKLIPDKDDAAVVNILCKFKAQLPDRTAGDQGCIVDKTICTQVPVTQERIAEILDFTGEKPVMKLAK